MFEELSENALYWADHLVTSEIFQRKEFSVNWLPVNCLLIVC